MKTSIDVRLTAMQCLVLGHFILDGKNAAEVAREFGTTKEVIMDCAKKTNIRRRLAHDIPVARYNAILNEFGDAVEKSRIKQ